MCSSYYAYAACAADSKQHKWCKCDGNIFIFGGWGLSFRFWFLAHGQRMQRLKCNRVHASWPFSHSVVRAFGRLVVWPLCKVQNAQSTPQKIKLHSIKKQSSRRAQININSMNINCQCNGRAYQLGAGQGATPYVCQTDRSAFTLAAMASRRRRRRRWYPLTRWQQCTWPKGLETHTHTLTSTDFKLE